MMVDIPYKQIKDLGFIARSALFFVKERGDGVVLFIDYRKDHKATYASKDGKWIRRSFKEFRALDKIEKHMEFLDQEKFKNQKAS